MFLVKLCEGKKVRDPHTAKLLELGKPLKIDRISAYWKRREADGEVVIQKAEPIKIIEKQVSEEKKDSKKKNN